MALDDDKERRQFLLAFAEHIYVITCCPIEKSKLLSYLEFCTGLNQPTFLHKLRQYDEISFDYFIARWFGGVKNSLEPKIRVYLKQTDDGRRMITYHNVHAEQVGQWGQKPFPLDIGVPIKLSELELLEPFNEIDYLRGRIAFVNLIANALKEGRYSDETVPLTILNDGKLKWKEYFPNVSKLCVAIETIAFQEIEFVQQPSATRKGPGLRLKLKRSTRNYVAKLTELLTRRQAFDMKFNQQWMEYKKKVNVLREKRETKETMRRHRPRPEENGVLPTLPPVPVRYAVAAVDSDPSCSDEDEDRMENLPYAPPTRGPYGEQEEQPSGKEKEKEKGSASLMNLKAYGESASESIENYSYNRNGNGNGIGDDEQEIDGYADENGNDYNDDDGEDDISLPNRALPDPAPRRPSPSCLRFGARIVASDSEEEEAGSVVPEQRRKSKSRRRKDMDVESSPSTKKAARPRDPEWHRVMRFKLHEDPTFFSYCV